MRWISRGVAVLAGVMGLVSVAVAGNRGLSPMGNRMGNRGLSPIIHATAAISDKYDAVLGACRFVEMGNPMGSAINSIPVLPAIYKFLKLPPNEPLGPRKVTVLEAPRHGTLQLETDAQSQLDGVPYHYLPDVAVYGGKEQFYKGSDQFSFDVEARGKHFKVIYTVYVIANADFVEEDPSNNLCPNPAMSWRISEAGAVSGDESAAMALNNWVMSDQMNAWLAAASGVTLSFGDLTGAAVGQTGK